MSISSNSILHYTNSIKNLKGIISQGFKLKYCMESTGIRRDVHIAGAFPMVCFCDIPLSQVKNHLDSYGYYGIGLSKDWAISRKLNPVLYLEQNSNLIDKLIKQVGLTKNNKGKFNNDYLNDFIHICSFTKNYEGEIVRKGKKIEDYRFYDEREWRYVPTSEELDIASTVIPTEMYLKNKASFNNALENIKLEFSHSDISYIILKDEKEISSMTSHLRKIFESRCTSLQLEVLLTKITTVNQILRDF